jgi:hypothetical protein
MDYFLKSATKKALLKDLREAGFEWYDYDESTCVYLGHIVETPAVVDEEGNVVTPAVMTKTYHANVRMRKPHDFKKDVGKPTKPQFAWA